MTTVAKFKLTESQMRKLAAARKNGTDVTLRLNKNMIGADGIPLPLTPSEYNKIQSGNTHYITISASRVKKEGFLPALIAALPAIVSAIGITSGVTGIARNIKSMVDKKRSGSGVRRKKKSKGNGISLNPK